MSTSSPRTILFAHGSDELYGSDVMLLHLIAGLDRGRFRPVVALPNDLPYEGRLSAELARLGVPTHRIDLAVARRSYLRLGRLIRYPFRFISATAHVLRIIRLEDAALVHTNTIAVWPAAIASALLRRPHVWQIHELLEGSRTIRTLIGQAIGALSRMVVTNSHATRDSLFPSGRANVRVIPNGVNLPSSEDATLRAEVRAGWGAAAGDIVVGTVGRVSRRKGQSHFLEAAKRVLAEERNVRFVVVGGAIPGQERYMDDLQQWVQREGMDDRVTFTGFVSDVGPTFDALDLVVVPAVRPESFGLSAAEAMAHCKPVIASCIGALPEIIQSDAGVLVPPGDDDALTREILSLARDSARRAALGEQGREHVETSFGMDSYVQRLQTLYGQLLD